MLWCTKAINPDVTIEAGVNDTLLIDVDGVSESIVISGGDYHTNYIKHESHLIDALNEQFELEEVPVVALLGGVYGKGDILRKNVVVFKHKEDGAVENVGGNIASVLME